MQDFFAHFDSLRREGGRTALATVIGVDGGSAKRLGARMWVTEDGRTLGSLTVGGCVDGRAREEAYRVLADGIPRRIEVDLSEDGLDFGMSCAGSVEVFIEPVEMGSPVMRALERARSEVAAERPVVYVTPLEGHDRCVYAARVEIDDAVVAREAVEFLLDEVDPGCVFMKARGDGPDVFLQSFTPARLLVVAGAGPVADPLVKLGKMLGFRVVVIDAKSERLTRDRFPDADELLCGIPSELCKQMTLDARSCVVLTAHDYKYEVPVLREVLQHDVGYVGFVASRRRGGAVLEFLAVSGVAPDALKRVRVPVGLDVGAVTPAEIAVSVGAEILAARAGRRGGPLADAEARPEIDDLMAVIDASSIG